MFRTYNNDRPREECLGIDESYIPLEYFKGIFKQHEIRFAKDPFSSEEFLLHPGKGVKLITDKANHYVTKEDLEFDEWYIIGEPFYSTQFTPDPDIDRVREFVIQRYLSGERGLIKEVHTVEDTHGDYRKQTCRLDTESGKILERIHRITSLLYHADPTLMWNERNLKITCGEEIYKQIFSYFSKAYSDVLNSFEQSAKSLKANTIRLKSIPLIAIGKFEIEVDETIKDEFFKIERL